MQPTDYTPTALPKGLRRRKQGVCFYNAWDIASDDRYSDRLTYCEGWAVTDWGEVVHHAWLVDEDGNAYDPTWPRLGLRYFGVTFTVEEVSQRAIARGYVVGPMLDADAALAVREAM